MKIILSYLLIATFACLPALLLGQNTWKVKSDAAVVQFSGGAINGHFEGLKADIVFDKNHPEQARFVASIDVASIATGFFLKNSHAKSALGADDYPLIRFVSTNVIKNGAAYDASGLLTMKGAAKPITIHFTFTDNGNTGTFNGSFKVVPKEFGVTRSGTPAEVNISLIVPVQRG